MRIAGAALAIAVVAWTRVAAADPDPNIARADALFAEAQSLLEAGKLEAACAKYDASLALNREAIGTLLNVARCDARLGKLAHAVALYGEARDRGHEQNLPLYVSTAEEQIAKLTPLVPHLAIAFVEPPDGMKIVVDDKAVTASEATDVALDPGAHQITVTAPGRVPYETWVKLAKSERKALSVPALAYPTTVHSTRSSLRTIGKIVTGGGAALVGTSIVLGIVAKLHYDSADCDAMGRCSPEGFAATESARSLGNVGTGIGIAGLVIAATGVVLWVRAPRDHTERGVTLAPVLGPGEAGVVALGHF